MTPEQRNELLDAVEAHGKASQKLMMATYEGRAAADAQTETHDAYRRVLALVDEATDYSKAEAVSGE